MNKEGERGITSIEGWGNKSDTKGKEKAPGLELEPDAMDVS
jgi:hypothetical protein